MSFKAKLNTKFYIVSLILFAFVVFIWWGIYFLNTNVILMEDNTPMTTDIKLFFTIALSVVGLSWTLSLITVIRQIVFGAAFSIDENGIHNTATALNIFAFIFVVPIKNIPFNAINKITNENGVLTIYFDKDQINCFPLLRLFARKRFTFFCGFTTDNQKIIEAEIKKFIKQ